jgi:hypothetical protein
MDIWAKKLIYTVDIWATQFHLTLKSMWTIERLSQHLLVPTCKMLHEFVGVFTFLPLLNSKPALLGLNTKQERNYETIT